MKKVDKFIEYFKSKIDLIEIPQKDNTYSQYTALCGALTDFQTFDADFLSEKL